MWHECTKNAEKGTTPANFSKIQKNVHCLKTIAEVLLLFGKQDIALRGDVNQSHLIIEQR